MSLPRPFHASRHPWRFLLLAWGGLLLAGALPRGRAADGETKLGTAITALPCTISAPGVYVLRADLATAMPDGRGIVINASNVTLDLNGHTLTNTQAGNAAEGIFAYDQKNVTVRNGAVRGFLTGVDLPSSVSDGSRSSGHLIEEVAVRDAGWFAIRVWGNDNVVRRCRVTNAGGSAQSRDGTGYGIIAQAGQGARVLDNDVDGVNKSDAVHSAFGIILFTMGDGLVVGNRVGGPADYGLYYNGDASGKYRNNLVGAGVSRGYFGPGIDAGKNVVDRNANGIDDDWEMRYFGNLSTATATSDSDGDGVSDLNEYQTNTSPTDYYNGVAPAVMVASGNFQYGYPGQVLAQPLVAQVTRGGSGQPAANAPATFQVAAGQGQLAPTSAGPWTGTLTTRADGAGRAAVYLRLPAAAGAIAVVSMGAGTAAPVTFRGLQVGVAGASTHSVAVRNDGTVWAWGDNSNGRLGDGTTTARLTPVQVSGLTGVGAVCTGSYYTLALKADGTVWAWGYNNSGLLGDGTSIDRSTPVQVANLSNVVAIAAGYGHSLALKADGTVWAWGYNYYGELGDGTYTQRNTPVQVAALTGMIGIGAGEYHSMALKADGTVWTWGQNSYGQLGDGTTNLRPLPGQVVGLSGVTAVDTYLYYNLALKADGTVWGWGSNGAGQLGDGTTTNRSLPVQVSGLASVKSIATGMAHSLALKADGTVWAWGFLPYGQLGSNAPSNYAYTPVQFGGLTGVVAITAGDYQTLALTSDGRVLAQGYNGYGQLGNGTTTDAGTPVQTHLANLLNRTPGVGLRLGDSRLIFPQPANVLLSANVSLTAWEQSTTSIARVEFYQGNTLLGTAALAPYVIAWENAPAGVYHLTAKAITSAGVSATSVPVDVRVIDPSAGRAAAGAAHSLVLQPDGSVQAWGNNTYGQLGDGTTTGRLTPVAVPGLPGVVALSSFNNHSLALRFDGTVWAWGANESGQLGDGTTVQRNVPVQVKALTRIVAVAAGYGHSLALRNDGALFAWGNNASGQLGDGTTTLRPTPVQVATLPVALAVAAGYTHTLALNPNGTVWAWGANESGQLGDGTTTPRNAPAAVPMLAGMTDVSAGYQYSLALKEDGTVRSWGANPDGRLGDNTTTGHTSPVVVAGLGNVRRVVAGGGQSLAQKSDGSLWGWGLNTSGQLGDGTTVNRLTPVLISGAGSVATVAAGLGHTVTVRPNGTVLTSGANASGQLGDGTTTPRNTPTSVALLGPGADTNGVPPTITLTEPAGAVLIR